MTRGQDVDIGQRRCIEGWTVLFCLMHTNWAGNLTYGTHRVHYPGSVDEVQQVVRQCRSLRPLGSRHSFNRIADSTGNLVSVQRLNRVLSLDRGSKTVTVEAG